jgi:hypothetical protein
MDNFVGVIERLRRRDSLIAVGSVVMSGVGLYMFVGVANLGDGLSRENVGHPGGIVGVIVDDFAQ